MPRDLGLGQRVLGDRSRALGGHLGVRDLLQLDLELGHAALDPIEVARRGVVALLQALAIGLGLLELDAKVAALGGQAQHGVAAGGAATAAGLLLDHHAAEPAVLFLEGLGLGLAAGRVGRGLVALGLQAGDLALVLLALGPQLLDDLFLRDQADAPLLEHALLLVDHLAQVLDLGQLIVQLLPAVVLGLRDVDQLLGDVVDLFLELRDVVLRARQLPLAGGHGLGHLRHLGPDRRQLLAQLADLLAELVGDAAVGGDLLFAVAHGRAQVLDGLAQGRRLGAHALAVGDLAVVALLDRVELGADLLQVGGRLATVGRQAVHVDDDRRLTRASAGRTGHGRRTTGHAGRTARTAGHPGRTTRHRRRAASATTEDTRARHRRRAVGRERGRTAAATGHRRGTAARHAGRTAGAAAEAAAAHSGHRGRTAHPGGTGHAGRTAHPGGTGHSRRTAAGHAGRTAGHAGRTARHAGRAGARCASRAAAEAARRAAERAARAGGAGVAGRGAAITRRAAGGSAAITRRATGGGTAVARRTAGRCAAVAGRAATGCAAVAGRATTRRAAVAGRATTRRAAVAGRTTTGRAAVAGRTTTGCAAVTGRATTGRAVATGATLAARVPGDVALVEGHRAIGLGRRITAGDRRPRLVRRDERTILDVPHHDRATLHDVVVREHVALDALVVDHRAVGRLQVLDEEPAVLHPHGRMLPGHHAVVGADRALEPAADEQGDIRIEIDGAFATGRLAEQ